AAGCFLNARERPAAVARPVQRPAGTNHCRLEAGAVRTVAVADETPILVALDEVALGRRRNLQELRQRIGRSRSAPVAFAFPVNAGLCGLRRIDPIETDAFAVDLYGVAVDDRGAADDR